MMPADGIARAARSLAGVLVLGIAACDGVRYTEAFHPEGEISRVVVRADEGVVALVPGERLRVERAIRAPEGALDLRHEVADGVLTLDARCRILVFCAVDTEIAVPPGVEVEVELRQGEVWAAGVGALSVAMQEGTADLETSGDLRVQVGSGRVRADLSRDALAAITVGDGDIDVSVPPGRWVVDASAARLHVSGVTSADDATGRLELVAPSGTVRVTGRDRLARR